MKTLLETAEEIIAAVQAERDWFKEMLEKRDAEVERLRAEIARHYTFSSDKDKYVFDRDIEAQFADSEAAREGK